LDKEIHINFLSYPPTHWLRSAVSAFSRATFTSLLLSHRRSQGVQWVQVRPQREKKKLGAEYMGVSCQCTPEGDSAPPRSGGVTFLLGGAGKRGLGGIW